MSMSSIARESLDFHVIKELREGCDETSFFETLNIFKHGWKYRGEGNANVVLALQDDQRVIRLSKVNVGEAVGLLAKRRRKVEREVIFANKIFGPLIGREFVGSVEAIQLSTEEISRLNKMLENVRPAHRCHKEIRVPYATSHSDFARINRYPSDGGVDFCVEIKAKQGWWPSSMRSCGGDLPNLCTYCLNQFLKLKRAKISSRTSYCPLDLFSGNPQRMIEAITALIANPQNNFRIFSNGRLVFGDDDESLGFLTVLDRWLGCEESSASVIGTEMPSALNSFVYLLCVSLLKPKYIPDKGKEESLDLYKRMKRQLRKSLCHMTPAQLYGKIVSKSPPHQAQNPPNEENLVMESCNDEAHPLPEGSILYRILEIQKLADRQNSLMVPSIYNIYQKICPVHCKMNGEVGFTKVERISKARLIRAMEEKELNGRSPQLDVVLTGDSYDNFVDSGTETERLSDSESFEECFDNSSTDDEEDETITGAIEYKEDAKLNFEKKDCFSGSPSPTLVSACPSTECLEKERWLDEIQHLPLTEAEIMAVEMYLLAATAKDCSIMVTFAPANIPQEVDEHSIHSSSTPLSQVATRSDPFSFYKDTDIIVQDLQSRTHRVRIGVADLDPKPVTTIVRHYLRDNEMLQAYTSYCTV